MRLVGAGRLCRPAGGLLVLESHRSQEADRLLRLIGRYRTLLAEANDGLLRRGIEREIESLEQKLRRIDAGRRQNVPCLIARPGPARSEP
jgi:hypothetical protein